MNAKTQTQAIAPARSQSLVTKMAGRFGVDADKMLTTLKQTAFRTEKEASNEQMMALLIVADQYGLNPWTKEIYAFEDKFKGIVPVVSVDGWARIINERPELDAIEFDYAPDDCEDAWIECRITRKDRSKPLAVREYLSECRRDTGPWKSHTRRMLRHKALIQCARIAFGFGGIYDTDEAERIIEATASEPPARTMKPKTVAPRAIEAPKPEPIEIPALTHADIQKALDASGVPENALLHHFEVDCLESLPAAKLAAARDWIADVVP